MLKPPSIGGDCFDYKATKPGAVVGGYSNYDDMVQLYSDALGTIRNAVNRINALDKEIINIINQLNSMGVSYKIHVDDSLQRYKTLEERLTCLEAKHQALDETFYAPDGVYATHLMEQSQRDLEEYNNEENKKSSS